MSVDRLRREVEELVTELYEAGLAADSNPVVVEGGAGHNGCVTYPRKKGTAKLAALEGQLEEYQAALRDRLFTVALKDGALLQVSVTLEDNEVVWHRLAFVPCPVRFDADEVAEVSIDEFISSLDAGRLRDRLRLRAAIRFDYDPEAGGENHPESHYTVLASTCRVPVLSPLSVGHFARFVLTQFYREAWEQRKVLREWPCGERRRTGMFCRPNDLFLDWNTEEAS
ncbi:MAG: DUF2290 domain-containing protein [Thermoanaerobaculia bacterium]